MLNPEPSLLFNSSQRSSNPSRNTGFSPLSVSSLSGWWEADTITPVADGTDVTPIVDASSVGNNLIDPPGADRALSYYANVKNSKPSLRANGTSQYYIDNNNSKSNLLSANAWSCFAIGRVTSNTDNATLKNNDAFFSDKGGGDWGIFFKTGSGGQAIAANYTEAGLTKTVTLSYVPNTWAIFHIRLESGNLYFSINGGAESSVACLDTANGILTSGLFTGSFVDYTAMDMLGLAFWNKAVSGTEKANLLNYWNSKYAIY